MRARRSACALNSRRSLHFVPLCTHTEHSLLAVLTLLVGAASTVMYCKFDSWRNTARGRPLSQGVPSSKTVHWTVFEFTPGTRDFVWSISPSADGDEDSSRLPARSALLSLRLRGVHRTPAPSGLCKPLKRLDLNLPFGSPWLLFRSRLVKPPYGCRVSGANDYAN